MYTISLVFFFRCSIYHLDLHSFPTRRSSDLEFSSLIPQLGTVANQMCVIRSMYTFNPTHAPGVHLFHSGSILATRPSTGSWVTYGLGSENDNIPAFVVLNGGGGVGGGAGSHSGFLPSEFSGISFNSGAANAAEVIPNLRNQWVDASVQRHGL